MSGQAAVVDVDVVGEAISAAGLAAQLSDAAAGAVTTFEGVVRDHHEGKAVSRLEYEAYEPMAVRVLEEIVREAVDRWPVRGIRVRHRVGDLEVGDVAVAIVVWSAHRAEAFDALRYVIDTLKRRAPIWKRETGPDGRFWIEGPDHVASSD